MSMPETAVYENDRFIFGKNQVGFSWQIVAVKPVPESTGEQPAPHNHFRPSILAADLAHDATTDFLANGIHATGYLWQ